MSLNLLLDMDDTLLDNDMDRFLPAYLSSLSKHLADQVPPERMLQSLLAGTKAMIQKQLPAQRLVDAFDEVFYPGIGHTKNQLLARIEEFYAQAYPSLRSVTQVRPEAVEFVEWAFAQGYTLAIATNPLFPRTAIEQRLAWAGLPVTQYPFKIVSSYETFHFAQPNPAFLAEMIAQLEWPDQPVAMVGNSLTEDIQPANVLGLPAFHLQTSASPDSLNSGSFTDLKNWIRTVEGRQTPLPATPEAMLAVLSSTPAALDSIASILEHDDWRLRPQENEWSMGEIFCHLRDVDREVTLPRIDRILAEDAPFITAEATDGWADERQYALEEPGDALNGFLHARTRLLLALQKLERTDWSRPARHAIFGPTTLAELISFTITHDQDHIRQTGEIIRTLQKQ